MLSDSQLRGLFSSGNYAGFLSGLAGLHLAPEGNPTARKSPTIELYTLGDIKRYAGVQEIPDEFYSFLLRRISSSTVSGSEYHLRLGEHSDPVTLMKRILELEAGGKVIIKRRYKPEVQEDPNQKVRPRKRFGEETELDDGKEYRIADLPKVSAHTGNISVALEGRVLSFVDLLPA